MKVKCDIATLAGFILVIACACLLFVALFVGVGIQRRYSADYFINHQDEFVIDTISVNDMVDHYELYLK